MTRKGKIARLPLALREKLNERLQNGEQGKDLIQWLNSLPDVKTILDAHFDGQPISECNLTAWTTGGYLTWEQCRAAREELSSFLEKTTDVRDASKGSLTDRLAVALAAKAAIELHRIDYWPDCEEKSKAWRELVDIVAQLHRLEWLSERTRVNRLKRHEQSLLNDETERRIQKENKPEMSAEERDERIRQIMSVD
jgi:hypothetical protein